MEDSQEILIGTKENEQFLDKNVTVLLKDNKCLTGIFRSFDQYNNITLENVTKITFNEDMYTETFIQLVVIRGESILFLGTGELELSKYKITN